MDDRAIEESIRRVWQVDPPDDMFDKILARVEREQPVRRRWSLPSFVWKPALAWTMAAVVLFAGYSQRTWCARTAASAFDIKQSHVKVAAIKPLIERHRELNHLLAQAGTLECPRVSRSRNGIL